MNAICRCWSRKSNAVLGTSLWGNPIKPIRSAAPLRRFLQTMEETKDYTKNKKRIPTERKTYIKVDCDLYRKNKNLYIMPTDTYGASMRVTKFLQVATVEDAYEFLRALPFSLQSTIIWNQLLGHCAKTGRANLAENYFSQMRRRGLTPNERTFTSIIYAFARNDSPDIVPRAERWFQRMNDYNLQPSVFQVNALMRVYAHASRSDKMVDLFQDMGHDIVPDKVTYSTLFRYYPDGKDSTLLRSVWDDIGKRLENDSNQSSDVNQDGSSLLAKKAAEITLSEVTLRDQQHGKKLEVDDSLIAALMFAVAKSATEKEDVLFAIKLVAQLYGQCPPLAKRLLDKHNIEVPAQRYDFILSSKVLDAIMRAFSTMTWNRLAEAYFEQATRQNRQLTDDRQLIRTHMAIKRYTIENYKKGKRD